MDIKECAQKICNLCAPCSNDVAPHRLPLRGEVGDGEGEESCCKHEIGECVQDEFPLRYRRQVGACKVHQRHVVEHEDDSFRVHID